MSLCHSSQFEEKFEEIHGAEAEAPPNLPSNSGFNENQTATVITEESRGKEIEVQEQDSQRICTDLSSAQDFVSGIMKIVPSEVDVSLCSCLGSVLLLSGR